VYAAPVYAAPVYGRPVYHDRHYDVFYRECHRSPWRLYGTFHNHHRAHEVSERLGYRGFQSRVAHH
jgi:hypothetical protein